METIAQKRARLFGNRDPQPVVYLDEQHLADVEYLDRLFRKKGSSKNTTLKRKSGSSGPKKPKAIQLQLFERKEP